MKPVHASDCALHNAPALPVGPCDCGADRATLVLGLQVAARYMKDAGAFMEDFPDVTDALATMKAENVQAPVAGIRSALPPSSARERRMEEALQKITDHFAAVMAGPFVAGSGVVFANGVEGIPTIKAARAALSSDGRGREKGNTSNSDDGIDPAPPATESTKS